MIIRIYIKSKNQMLQISFIFILLLSRIFLLLSLLLFILNIQHRRETRITIVIAL